MTSVNSIDGICWLNGQHPSTQQMHLTQWNSICQVDGWHLSSQQTIESIQCTASIELTEQHPSTWWMDSSWQNGICWVKSTEWHLLTQRTTSIDLMDDIHWLNICTWLNGMASIKSSDVIHWVDGPSNWFDGCHPSSWWDGIHQLDWWHPLTQWIHSTWWSCVRWVHGWHPLSQWTIESIWLTASIDSTDALNLMNFHLLSQWMAFIDSIDCCWFDGHHLLNPSTQWMLSVKFVDLTEQHLSTQWIVINLTNAICQIRQVDGTASVDLRDHHQLDGWHPSIWQNDIHWLDGMTFVESTDGIRWLNGLLLFWWTASIESMEQHLLTWQWSVESTDTIHWIRWADKTASLKLTDCLCNAMV